MVVGVACLVSETLCGITMGWVPDGVQARKTVLKRRSESRCTCKESYETVY